MPVEISEFGNNPTVIKSVIESESRRERSKEVYEILRDRTYRHRIPEIDSYT